MGRSRGRHPRPASARGCWKNPSCGLASPPLSAPHAAAVLSDPGRRALRKHPRVRSSGGKSHGQDGRGLDGCGLEGRGPQPLSQGLKIHTYLLKVKEFSATQTREVGPFLSWKPPSRSGGAQRHYLQRKRLTAASSADHQLPKPDDTFLLFEQEDTKGATCFMKLFSYARQRCPHLQGPGPPSAVAPLT